MSGKNANTIHEQDEFLVVRMAEHQVGSELQKLKDHIIERAEALGYDLDILVDVSGVKTSEEGANTVARTFFKDLPFKHMAVFGGSKAVNVGIKLILNLFISMGVGEVKLFKTENKAKEWLQNS